MKKRGLVISLLVLLAVVTSGFTYAFWAAGVTGNDTDVTGTVNIGTGEAVTVSMTVNETTTAGQILVPAGFEVDPGEVDAVTVSFTVKWNDDAALDGIADATVAALVSNIQVNGVANPYSLVTITPSVSNPTTIALNATVTFSFVITLTEPANATQYTAVAGLPITFDINFSVTPA
jgi:hypothetical protein